MPDLTFKVSAAKPAATGLTPLLQFRLLISNKPADETIHAIILHSQIHIQSPRRNYDLREKDRLRELFGLPCDWGRTLRDRLWTSTNATVNEFKSETETVLSVPCTYDLNVASAKYFYALEEGNVPLLFLFSGTVFYATPEGRLQVQQISWNKECAFKMPVRLWQEMMEAHYPDSGWVYFQREVFERLYAYRRNHGYANWEQTIESLLATVAAEHRERELVSA